VDLLLARLGDGTKGNVNSRSSTPSQLNSAKNPNPAGRSRETSLDEDAVAPVFVLRDLTAETGNVSQSNGQSAVTQIAAGYEDIITAGLVSQNDAVLLLSM
jgi:hypothetical protein